MIKTKLLTTCLVFILGLFFSFTNILGQTVPNSTSSAWSKLDQGKIDEAINNLSPISKLPDDTLYFLITLKENTQRLFKPTPIERCLFDIKLSGKRLKESYLLLKKGENEKTGQNLKRYNDKANDIYEQFEKIEKQNLPNVQTADYLIINLFYQQRLISAATAEDQLATNSNLQINFKESVGKYESLVKLAIEKTPERSHELTQILPPENLIK